MNLNKGNFEAAVKRLPLLHYGVVYVFWPLVFILSIPVVLKI